MASKKSYDVFSRTYDRHATSCGEDATGTPRGRHEMDFVVLTVFSSFKRPI